MASTLDIRLKDQIRVLDLDALLASVHTIYVIDLWLEKAEALGEALPEDWAPEPQEELWISVLKIGTPNWLRLKGKTAQMSAVAALLTVVVGGGGVVGALGTMSINEKTRAESEKIRIEAEIQKLELLRKLDKMYKDGTITEQQYYEKRNAFGWVVSRAPEIKKCVPPQAFKPVGVELEAQPGTRNKSTEDVESIIAAIGNETARGEVLRYLNAQKAFGARRDKKSQRDLAQAYDRLAVALAPMRDHEIHELIERLRRAGA